MSGVEAVIFDFDGVMVDTEKMSFQAWQDLLHPFGQRLTEADYPVLLGLDEVGCARYICEQTGMSADPVSLSQQHWSWMVDLIHTRLEPLPGLFGLLDELAARGLPLGVASNSPTDYVQTGLATIRVSDRFRTVIGADQVAECKPAPDVYLAAAQRLGVDPHACLAVEDSPVGLRAALAAGMRCVVVNAPRENRDWFSGASACFTDLTGCTTALGTVLQDGAASAAQ